MRLQADEIVERARRLVGTRFRPHGRSPDAGLDCVGLVAAALGITDAPCDYPLRSGTAGRVAAELSAAGLRRAENMRRGDVVILSPGPRQLHLGLYTGTSLIHGDAVLRRVVERPLPIPWPVLEIWRM